MMFISLSLLALLLPICWVYSQTGSFHMAEKMAVKNNKAIPILPGNLNE